MTARSATPGPSFAVPKHLLVGVAALAVALIAVAVAVRNAEGSSAPTAAPDTIEGTLAFWEARASADPTDYVSQNRVADGYLRLWRRDGNINDFSRAEAALEASVASNSLRNYGGVSRLALVRGTQHRFEEAVTLATDAIASDPRPGYAYGVLGDALRELGRNDEAAAAYDEMLARQPGLASFSRLAAFQSSLGNDVGAEVAWQSALSFATPDRPEDVAWAWTEYGRFLLESGSVAKAEQAFRSALEAQPGHGPAGASLATLMASRGELTEALERFETIAVDGNRPEYFTGLGELRFLTGDVSGAQDAYRRAEAQLQAYQDAGIRAELLFANFYAEHDLNIEAGLAAGQIAYERRPSAETGSAYAWGLYKSSRYAEADAILSGLVDRGEANAAAMAKAGFVALALGQRERAETLLSSALDSNPAFAILLAAEARDTLAQLR